MYCTVLHTVSSTHLLWSLWDKDKQVTGKMGGGVALTAGLDLYVITTLWAIKKRDTLNTDPD